MVLNLSPWWIINTNKSDPFQAVDQFYVDDRMDLLIRNTHVSERMTKQLVINSMGMAITNERPAAGLIFHSDRGS